jgi:hypothetical protein
VSSEVETRFSTSLEANGLLAKSLKDRSAGPARSCAIETNRSADMGKGLLLWLIGVPIPVIIILWLLFR